MIDREKVVRAVETCFDSWIDRHWNMGLDLHEVEQMKRDALELLREQEPVKPIVGEYGARLCGNCGEEVGVISDSTPYKIRKNYCPECGRAVKWDE